MLRTIRATPQFERDAKRLRRKHYDLEKLGQAVNALFGEGVNRLRLLGDHTLRRVWQGYRELHIEGDWLLINRVNRGELDLVLTRTGSHDQVF